MAYFKSLGEYIETLDKAGMLTTIKNPINKDTELGPLVRLQFRGLPEEERKGFLFTNVTDSRGNKYDVPCSMATTAATREMYAVALQCKIEEIPEKLAQAYSNPIDPVMVESGPVQEVVHIGDSLLEKGGMDQFPAPITTPGRDAGPVQSASMWVTKDPDTGERNVGLYRSHIFAQDRMGIHLGQTDKDMVKHWQKCRTKGVPLQCAIVVGGPPNVVFVGPTRLPYGKDEYAVAGSIAGEALELVKCKTVDIEVPANAEVVIEGEMSTEELEMEAPHGEGGGIVGMQEMQPFLKVTCITHRKNPIWHTLMSQLGPCDSGTVSRMHSTGMLHKRLKLDLKLPNVIQVGRPEFTTGARGSVVLIQMKMHSDQDEVWRALEAANGEYVIAVDDDIDVWHPDQFWWAVTMRALPHRDIKIVTGSTTTMHLFKYMTEPESLKRRVTQFDPSQIVPVETSHVLINATLKWDYPPSALPTKEFMEGALRIWEKEGLPPLKLQAPWYSHELGWWPQEFAEDAARAVRGEYYKTSEMRAQKRQSTKDYPKIEPEGEK